MTIFSLYEINITAKHCTKAIMIMLSSAVNSLNNKKNTLKNRISFEALGKWLFFVLPWGLMKGSSMLFFSKRMVDECHWIDHWIIVIITVRSWDSNHELFGQICFANRPKTWNNKFFLKHFWVFRSGRQKVRQSIS